MIGKLIGGLIGIMVMIMLVGPISKQVKDVSTNFTGSYTASGVYKEEYDKSGRKQTYEEYVRERIKVERIMKRGWIGRWI